MTFKNKHKVAAVTLLVGGLAICSAIAAAPDERDRGASKLEPAMIKIGNHYINLQHVSCVTIEKDSLVIVFDGNTSSTITLKGDQASAMRAWLDSQSKIFLLTPRPQPVKVPSPGISELFIPKPIPPMLDH